MEYSKGSARLQRRDRRRRAAGVNICRRSCCCLLWPSGFVVERTPAPRPAVSTSSAGACPPTIHCRTSCAVLGVKAAAGVVIACRETSHLANRMKSRVVSPPAKAARQCPQKCADEDQHHHRRSHSLRRTLGVTAVTPGASHDRRAHFRRRSNNRNKAAPSRRRRAHQENQAALGSANGAPATYRGPAVGLVLLVRQAGEHTPDLRRAAAASGGQPPAVGLRRSASGGQIQGRQRKMMASGGRPPAEKKPRQAKPPPPPVGRSYDRQKPLDDQAR